MKNIIAYSLFQRVKHVKRVHDVHNDISKRYWFNIPSLCIINSIFFPECITRFYVHKDMMKKPRLFSMLQGIAQKCPKVELVLKKGENLHSQPMLWRMKPLWDADTESSFARDIDSIVNEDEVRRMKIFMNGSFLLHSIRSHPHHNEIPIYGGLCGFNVPELRKADLIVPTYKDFVYYKNNRNFNFGGDQWLLVDYFFTRKCRRYVEKYLDSPIVAQCFEDQRYVKRFKEPHSPVRERNDGSVCLGDEIYDRVDLSYVPKDIRFLCNSITKWAGEPVDSRGNPLSKMLEADTVESKIVKNIINGDKKLKKFYKV